MLFSSVDELPPAFRNLNTKQKQAALQQLNAMLNKGMEEEVAIRATLRHVKTLAAEPGAEYWREVSRDARARLAKEGKAIPVRGEGGEIIDGRYPIANEADLRNAIQASGRGGPADFDSVIKPHIKKRARALGRSDLIPENWSETTVAIGFAAPAIEGDEASPEFTVLRAGTFQKGGREITISESDLDKAVANFQRWQEAGQEVPVDYDHSFAERGESRAAGWLAALRRAGDRLLARVKWNGKALEELRAGEYRYFSPEFHPEWSNEDGEKEGFTVVGGALTNRPFLRGITRVAFSLDRLDEPYMREFWERAPVDLVIAISNLEARDDNRIEMAEETQAPPETEPEVPEEENESVKLSQREYDELRQRAGETETLSQRVQKLESQLADERFAQTYDRALREGRIDAKPETRERWHERFRKFGHDEGRALLFELPAETIPLTERGQGSEAPQWALEAPEGTDPYRYAIHTRAEQLMASDEKLEYVDAVTRAEAELKAAS